MNRREFLRTAGGGLATAAVFGRRRVFAATSTGGSIPQATSTPNLLYMVCDQMREMAMGCSGDPNLSTPNFNRLAAAGLRSTRTFTSCPLCCPARSSMQTGHYPHNVGFGPYSNGHHLSEDVPTIAEFLSAAGYATAHIGKWHLNGTALTQLDDRYVPPEYHRGYDYWLGFEHGHKYYGAPHYAKDDTPIYAPEGQYEPDFQTDHALQYIEDNAHHPWMMHLSWGPPHFPLETDNVPADVLAAIDATALQLRQNVPGGVLTEAQRLELAIYYAMINTLDANLGRLLDKLDVLGLTNNTIVVFTSDHGEMMYSHGNIYKRRPQEESSRVPFLIRHPGVIPAGQVSEELMSLVDLPVSLTELMGVPGMQTEGVSFVDHWKGTAPIGPREAVFMGCHWLGGRPNGGNYITRPWRGVRTRTHMGCWLRDEGGATSSLYHLFDVAQDPYELNELRDDASEFAAVTELQQRLQKHLKQTGDNNFPQFKC